MSDHTHATEVRRRASGLNTFCYTIIMNWDEIYSKKRDYLWLPTQLLSQLFKFADLNKGNASPYTSLDIGCGTGQLVRDLYHRGFIATGIDTSEAAIAIAKSSTIREDGISFYTHDISKTPIKGYFNLITCKYVIAFIEQRDDFLKNVSKALNQKEPSAFAIITPNPQSLPENKKNISIEPTELLTSLTNHFEDVTTHEVGADFWYICKQPKR